MKAIMMTLIVLIILPLVSGSPPDVPVLLYGKVVYDNRLPAAGIGVRAIWIDKNGDINTRVTRTINVKEAGILNKPDLLGLYKFEIYDVSDGSKIKIESGKKSTIIDAVYGVQTKVPDIIIDLPRSKETNNFTAVDNSSSISSVIDYIAKILGLKDNYGILENNDSDINDLNNINKSDIDTKNIIDTKNNLYEFSNLTEDELNELNKSLDSRSYDEDGTKEPFREDPLDSGSVKSKINMSLYSLNNNDPTEETFFKKFYENDKKINYIFYMIFAFVLMFIFLVIFGIIKVLGSKERKIGIVNVSLNNVNSLESKTIMTKRDKFLSLKSNLLDAIEIFSSNNISVIPVLSDSKSILGVVTKKDLLIAIESPDFRFLENTKISTIMKKKYVSCKKDQELGDIYNLMLQKKVNEMIVEEKGFFLGTIDFFDILNVFNRINFTIDNPPTLGEASNPDVTIIDHKTTLEMIRKKLLDVDSEYALVIKKGRPVGIVTLKDIIIAIEKNMDFKTSYAEHIMSGNLVSMTPGTSVYDAFKVMLERRFNQIPLIMSDKTTGMVNIKFLVKMYYDFINDLNERLKKNPFNAVKIMDEK